MERIPFDRDTELKVTGEYAVAGFNSRPGTPIPKINTPMTPKEHYLRLMRGEKPLWLPTGYDFVNISPSCIPDNVARAFIMELTPFPIEKVGGPDFFGVEWEYVPKAGGSMVRAGKPKVPDICSWEEYITFPDLKKIDWAQSAKQNSALIDGERVVCMTILNGLFERLISFMDFSEAAVALIDDEQKDAVHRLFSRLCDFYEEEIAIFKKYYNIDQFCLHDDWGSQRAPFFSPDTVREMLLPYVKRLVDFTHSQGLIFELHSCGKNEILTPVMIEAGVDVWKPQPKNDIKYLCKEYGDKIRIGISPDGLDPYNMPTEPAQFIAIAEAYVEKCRGYVGVGCSSYIGREFFETVYTLTREEYCNL
jgi:hypothetical protein